MINDTNSEIRYTSYRFFLEKGYEATNIRDICKIVNIKPSSLYFYYKSKQDLFFSIYDDIWDEKIKYMKNIEALNSNISSKLKFEKLYIKTIEYIISNILDEKFLLRYHFFPAEDIATLITDRYRYWTKEENRIIEGVINECIEAGILDKGRNINEYLQDYKKFVTNQIINMLIYSVKISLKDQKMIWDIFWSFYISTEHKPYF